MSAVSKTLNGKQSIDPSTFMSEAASQLVGEEDEEIKNNVGICFFHTRYLYRNNFHILKLGDARGWVRTIIERTSV